MKKKLLIFHSFQIINFKVHKSEQTKKTEIIFFLKTRKIEKKITENSN